MNRDISPSNITTKALSKITNGFYIVTAKHEDKIAAGVVQWVTQACFNPPLIIVCIQDDSHLNNVISMSNSFALNILGEDQKHLVAPFGKPTKVEHNQLNGCPFQNGKTGSPILIDLPAHIECKTVESLSKGDHTIFIGELIDAGVREEKITPLVEWDTDYHYGG